MARSQTGAPDAHAPDTDGPDKDAPDTDGPVHRNRGPAYAVAGLLLLAPFVGLLWVSSYNSDSPRLFGFPFFYWYQFLWVLLSAVFTYLAYLLVRAVERPRARLTDRSER